MPGRQPHRNHVCRVADIAADQQQARAISRIYMEVERIGSFAEMPVVLGMSKKVDHAIIGLASPKTFERARPLKFDEVKIVAGRVCVLATINNFKYRDR